MERQEIDAVLEAFAEMATEQYVEPMIKLLDVILLHLAARSAIDPRRLATQLHYRLREMTELQRESVGARILERCERLSELLAAGDVSEDVLHKMPRTDLRLVGKADKPAGG